ncbi:MAG TPA: aconitate hydratase AcnA, partial [Pseudomonadales bacterium]
SLAGPKRPQDRVSLSGLRRATEEAIELSGQAADAVADVAGEDWQLQHGAVVIAAITSCTNTSNPAVMMAAGLLAKNAVEKGLLRKPWVKSSLAPGSKVVTDYLDRAGLTPYLDRLGFNLVGYGCTTCIGNSGPLAQAIETAIDNGRLTVSSVLSGNRNFEGRIHPKVRANWLASPPLVVAFALAGTTRIDLASEPLGEANGQPVYLKDIWPSSHEISDAVAMVDAGMFSRRYADVFEGDDSWRAIQVAQGNIYQWQDDSTYIRNPPFFDDAIDQQKNDISGARILALLGDSITTDHISPAGTIARQSPAADYLRSHGVDEKDFNSYGARRGNHEVMMRGTFANVRIKNMMLDGVEGGYTRHIPSGRQMSIYDAAMAYAQQKTPLVVIAGKEYGTGSSRDWAAKGTRLLGVRAVIAESFERIHRSNLVGMGVLPLQFVDGHNRQTLALDGSETITVTGLDNLQPGARLTLQILRSNGEAQQCPLQCRIDTADEIRYYYSGGILHYVLQQLLASGKA